MVPGPICAEARQIWLVMHPDVRSSPRLRAVADAVIELVAEAKQLLAGEDERT